MKLLKALVVLLVAAGLIVPAVAMAEDRLSLSGEMRVRAFHVDDDSDYTETWANQRLRIAGKIAVAEGVSVTFRTDITEGTNWGDSSGNGGVSIIRTNGFGHARSGAQQQWDRAHLDIAKGNFHLRAGQQYIGTGGTWAVDTQDSGLALDIVGAMPVKIFGIVDKDNGSKTVSDGFLYGIMISPKGDNFSGKLFAAGQTDGSDEKAYVFGASGSTDLGAIKLFGELDFFTGDHSATRDAMGTQAIIDASMAAGAATIGGQLMYAMGDTDDKQYVRLGNGFNGWDPVYDVGTSLSNEEIGLGNPFDFTGMNAGVVGARLYGSTAMGATKLGASIAYLETEEDDAADGDALALAAGLVYDIAASTTFQLQLGYQDGEVNSVDYEEMRAGTGIFVKF